MSVATALDLPEPDAGEEAPALFRDRQELQCKLLEWMQENLGPFSSQIFFASFLDI